MVDVKNKRCEASGCMKRGLFGFDGERARFCGGHRLDGEHQQCYRSIHAVQNTPGHDVFQPRISRESCIVKEMSKNICH